MNYADAKTRLERSAVLKLLKAENAPLCLGFLGAVFRTERAVWRNQSEMVSRLTTVIEEINEAEDEGRYPRPAKDYLDQWVTGGALLTRYNEENEVLYELTPEADQALLILEELGERPKNTAGAESKLRAITMTLQEISERANPNRDTMIAALREKVIALNEQIDRLKAGETLVPDSVEKLMERYQFAVDLARQLLADFSLIRQRFLGLARELAEQHASVESNRGTILARALDVHRELQDGPLGQSFAGFQDFLHSPESQAALFKLIDQITRLEGIGAMELKHHFLHKLPASLLDEAKSVVAQTRRLSAELRQMLDAQALTTRRQTHETLAALRALCYRLADAPPEPSLIGITRTYAETTAAENFLRLPWRPPDHVVPIGASRVHEVSSEDKERARRLLAEMPAIEIVRLQSNLDSRFGAGDNAFRLVEMLDWFPPVGGNWLLDVVGYLEIARYKGSRHAVRSEPDQLWVYQPADGGPSFRLPQIYFYR